MYASLIRVIFCTIREIFGSCPFFSIVAPTICILFTYLLCFVNVSNHGPNGTQKLQSYNDLHCYTTCAKSVPNSLLKAGFTSAQLKKFKRVNTKRFKVLVKVLKTKFITERVGSLVARSMK